VIRDGVIGLRAGARWKCGDDGFGAMNANGIPVRGPVVERFAKSHERAARFTPQNHALVCSEKYREFSPSIIKVQKGPMQSGFTGFFDAEFT